MPLDQEVKERKNKVYTTMIFSCFVEWFLFLQFNSILLGCRLAVALVNPPYIARREYYKTEAQWRESIVPLTSKYQLEIPPFSYYGIN